MVAVRLNGCDLIWASEELKGDRRIVMAAVQQNGLALEHAAQEMRGDRDIVMAAVQQNGMALKDAAKEMKGDSDVVLKALRNPGFYGTKRKIYMMVSEEMQRNDGVRKAARVPRVMQR
jgi:hypothetical protein